MAGDWIKLECVTPDKPEVIAMSEVLKLDQDAVLGKLIRLWIWADQQTYDGNAKGNAVSVTKSFIDRCTCTTGFAEAMILAGWLLQENGALVFPNFDRHNGKTAKNRALLAKRVALCKQRKGNKKVTLGALPREEKRRDKEINKVIGISHEEFISLWNALDGVVKVRGTKLTGVRASHFKARMQDAQWRSEFQESFKRFPFKCTLNGGWKPDLDWFLRPGSVNRILEGKYDWSKESGSRPQEQLFDNTPPKPRYADEK